MADTTNTTEKKWRWALVGAIAVFLVALGFIVLLGTGLLPGDTADTAGNVTASEVASGGQLGFGAWPWAVLILLATIILGGAIAFGQYRASKATRRQMQAGEAATHELYAKDDRR